MHLLPGTVLLDTVRPDAENRTSLLFTAPHRILTASTPAAVPPLLADLDAAIQEGFYTAGYLSYEAGYAFESVAPMRKPTEPLAWFGVYDAPRVLNADAVDTLLDAPEASYTVSAPRLAWSKEAYAERIRAIKHHIREGDVYQINFTGALNFDFDGSPVALYRALRGTQRVPYAAYLNPGDITILSLSPELFFRRDGRRIWTRPMKGTIQRGLTPAGDERLADWLASDPKSRAENLMIVDLLRNDLARVCEPGSVHVPALFTTEPYETLIQMTSTVEGRLCDGIHYADLFRALFPCGSVTGAPKLRAMQLIHTLEQAPRGVYCGAIGYAGPGDEAVFNVAIRTLTLQDGRGRMGVGSGIVWDSEAETEYEECRLKARFFTDPPSPRTQRNFQLIETMRWADGIALLDLHADRLAASARFFGFPFDEAVFRDQIRQATAGFAPGTAHKVRVTLDAAGRLGLTTTALSSMPDRPLRVMLATTPVDAGDVFCYHKTTRRVFYETAYRAAVDAGYDEVLFLNERGEVTEGSRTNVFIRRAGRLLTPPIASGLLGGVYRRHVLDTHPEAAAAVLHPSDLHAADAVYLCNAVWGLREADVDCVCVFG